jgi:hypothetical protein
MMDLDKVRNADQTKLVGQIFAYTDSTVGFT